MGIEKSNFKVPRFDSEFSHASGETTSSDEEDFLQNRISVVDADSDEDGLDDADSGAGSDDFDLLELAETGAEFCKVGNVTCSISFELYDLPGLEDILSLEVWNEYLTEEDRISLTKHLPDMDRQTFMHTLKELFEGSNFHFGSPIKKLFNMLKGGQCEPRTALYLEGRNFFGRTKHYHLLRKYHNDMVVNLCQIRDGWTNYKGYSIDEKLRVLSIMKNQKNLMCEKVDDFEAESSEREESFDGLRSKKTKEWRSAQNKIGRSPAYRVDPSSELAYQGFPVALEQAKFGKQNSKGTTKTASSKFALAKESLPSVYSGLDVNSGSYSTSVALRRQKHESALRDQMRNDDDDDARDPLFGMGARRDRDVARGRIMDKSGLLRLAKKHDFLRDEEPASNRLMGLPYESKPPNLRSSYEFVEPGKYTENIQPRAFVDRMKSLKGQSLQRPLKGSLAELSDRAELYWRGKTQGEAFSVDPSLVPDDQNIRRKKWKAGRESPDISLKSYRLRLQQMNSERFLDPEFGENMLQEKIRVNVASNGGPSRVAVRGSTIFRRHDDTESDSSDGYDDEDGTNPSTWSELEYSNGGADNLRSPMLKSGRDSKKAKSERKHMQENDWRIDGKSTYTKNMGKIGEHSSMPGPGKYLLKAKQKGKMRDSSPLNNSATRVYDDSLMSGLGKLKEEEDSEQIFRPDKNSRLQGQPGENRSRRLSLKPSSAERKRKGFDEDDDCLEKRSLVTDNIRGRLAAKKGQIVEARANDCGEKADVGLVGCSTVSKKRKAKEFLMDMETRDENQEIQFDLQQPTDEPVSSKKKGKRKTEAVAVSPDLGTFETAKVEIMGATDMETETKPQKKPFTLITPTIHSGFSFSIIHLLAAVRMAMITTRPEDALEDKNREHVIGENGVSMPENADTSKSHQQGNLPSLTVQEIVNCVRSNPGDPCILETQEPLQDLVRGVMKIFSSKTSPLGAKGWKALVAYEKSTKSWCWTGPVPHSSADHETFEEVTSPEAWGLPHKMLVKLVDAFANWLKNGQETLQQIGSLPAPPLSLTQYNLDEKERFKDLRAQKSLNTIAPSSDEARTYFRKEEVLRYSIPDRAFAYTAADGRKSIVAPLRRGGGKPTSKARDHFMLKRDRPPHVTILCLVRDAASRLPGSIGTRADVCTLIRDSQYIVEDVTDAQVNQVVSGALDRLHYERDPCVQFDAERKLWVYLHRDREEEDFEDDGTSSTKKWKRPKKDTSEQSDQGAVTVAFCGNGDQSGFDLGSDLNAEPACIDEDNGSKLLCTDERQNAEDEADDDNEHEDQTIVSDAVGSNPEQDNNFFCQENSVNADFDDET